MNKRLNTMKKWSYFSNHWVLITSNCHNNVHSTNTKSWLVVSSPQPSLLCRPVGSPLGPFSTGYRHCFYRCHSLYNEAHVELNVWQLFTILHTNCSDVRLFTEHSCSETEKRSSSLYRSITYVRFLSAWRIVATVSYIQVRKSWVEQRIIQHTSTG